MAELYRARSVLEVIGSEVLFYIQISRSCASVESAGAGTSLHKAETGHSTTPVQPKGLSAPVVLFRRHNTQRYIILRSISHHRNNFSLPSSVVERVTSNDEVVSSILAEGIVFVERSLLAH